MQGTPDAVAIHAVAEALRVALNAADVARQPDGRWLIVQDLWNSDRPPSPAVTDAAAGARGA